MKDGVDKVQALCREMLDRCLATIRERYESLPATCGTAAEAARSRYDEGVQALTRRSVHDLAYEGARMRSRADFEARHKVLKTREACLQALLDEGRAECRRLWEADPKPYALDLAAEGVVALATLAEPGDEGCEVRLPASLRLSLEEDFLARLEPVVRARLGRAIDLCLAFPEPSLPPGVVVATSGGRVLFDNTLEDRYRRRCEGMREELGARLDEGTKLD